MESFDEIVAFARVVESGSFAGGAQLVGVTPSAISKAVSRLEARLGAKLLHRTTRTLNLTDAGRAFYARCVDLIKRLEEAECEIACMNGRPAGRLRVSAPSGISRAVLAPALPRFCAQFPGLSLQLLPGDRLVDLVEEGFDVVLRLGELSDSLLHARRLGTLDIVTIASPAFLARHGEPASPEDIDPRHCVGLVNPNKGQVRGWKLSRGSEVRYIEPAAPIAIGEAESLLACVVAGAGIGCMPRITAAAALASGEVKALLPDWQHPTIPVYAVFAGDRATLAKIRVFVDFTVGLFGGAQRAAQRPHQGNGIRRSGGSSAGSQPEPSVL